MLMTSEPLGRIRTACNNLPYKEGFCSALRRTLLLVITTRDTAVGRSVGCDCEPLALPAAPPSRAMAGSPSTTGSPGASWHKKQPYVH